MTVELRPLGVTCNLACHYCYQNPQRDAGHERVTYDLERMKAAALHSGGPFTLFGGEPLMMRFADLDHLFAWGLKTFGENAIQTNGVLIEPRHVALFRRYKVSVGVSIDGPGALNDARWHRGLDKTRQSTALVQQAIALLCQEHEPPGLIVTLHRGNATADRLPTMFAWLRELDALGIRSVRLHLLEVDHQAVRQSLALSAGENIAALTALAEFEPTLSGMRFDLFREMEQLLAGQDGGASCTWRACDPYTTSAVQGVEGDGQTSNCGRTNKDGISFTKAPIAGYERYLALYHTPQAEKGCAGCRFFLMCKGQCPGTAEDGDWRNRTEHCSEWMHLFAMLERRMILAGSIPLTIQPLRLDVEKRQLEHWAHGENPSLGWIAAALYRERAAGAAAPAVAPRAAGPRLSWASDAARDLWAPRLDRIQGMLEDTTLHQGRAPATMAAARLVPESSLPRLLGLAACLGVATAVLPAALLAGGIRTRPEAGPAVTFLAGTPAALARARAAQAGGDATGFRAALDLPACCALPDASPGAALLALLPERESTLPDAVDIHPFLAPLGLSVLPVLPCRLDCPTHAEAAARWLTIAAAQGYAEEVAWLRACLSWATAVSALHGILEIKTPVFKLALGSGGDDRPRLLRRLGPSRIEGSPEGLHFPFAAPARPGRDSLTRHAS